ncbi:MAG: serine/threonine protein kinase [Myxococcota bacterium]|nr:serine/threonine protein kinase [Myxococcota bacterium]
MPVGDIQPVSELRPGYLLDRYELLCLLAHGGMASVWAARPVEGHGAERIVSIKTILPKFAADPRFQEMFLREGGLAARISHRNVARIFDLGETHGILYIAMEYVDGDALSKLHRACQKQGLAIPAGVALRLLADTCAGLHCAHELRDGTGRLLNVVHRDVSPPNILISTAGVAKLIDFGIAKTQLRSGEDTDSGTLKGKTRYMAPEQALGENVDRRVDIWAVGATLYDLLAGRPPYTGDNLLATLQLIVSGHPPPPLPQTVHPAVAALTERTLAHRPDGRFATATQLREAIERAMILAKLDTTSAEVAAFAAPFLNERAEARQRTIDLALKAAAERRRNDHEPHAMNMTTGTGPSATAAATSDGPPARGRSFAAVVVVLLLAVLVMAVGAVTTILLTMDRWK